jgi:transposase-like protein
VKGDWDAWNTRPLVDGPIVRLILDIAVVWVRLDRRATPISQLVALGVRADGQKVLLAIRSMGGESEAAWQAAVQRSTVHKRRNLLAYAPERPAIDLPFCPRGAGSVGAPWRR